MLPFILLAVLPHFDLRAAEKSRLIAEADSVITLEPKTIVTAVNPRSAGGPHDWSSEGDYWWPNPAKPDGAYLQKDGLTNPANFVAHRELMLTFVRAFDALAAAYRVTGDERYATAAVRHLHAWFVDPATRMNPNLKYAQAIHGLYVGRGIGIIDTVHFAEVALGVEALRKSPAFSPAENAAVTGWFRDYLNWLMTSKNGHDEEKAPNNHGTCWVLQAAAFAHVIDNRQLLDKFRLRFELDLLPHQMAPISDPKLPGPPGSFPRELARTKPYGYSIFNLDVMTALAQILSTPEQDLLHFTTPDGKSIIQGIAFLAPYLTDKTAWLKLPEVKGPDVMYWNDWPARQPFLIFGALATGNETWLQTWEKLDPDPTVEEIRRNLPIRQPVLWVQ
jgi:hypothetical protein